MLSIYFVFNFFVLMQHFEASQIRRMPGLHLGKLQKENMTQTALVCAVIISWFDEKNV